MNIEQRPKVLPHMLMPGQTIQGVIKQFNLYEVTKEEAQLLIGLFKDINGDKNFKPGERVYIPILERLYQRVF